MTRDFWPVVGCGVAIGCGIAVEVGVARHATWPDRQASADAMVANFLVAAEVYESTFRNLLAEETKLVEEFDASGKRTKGREIVSDFMLYSSSRSNATAEYRDVLSVDGGLVKKRDDRAMTLLTAASGESSVEKELTRINAESAKYEFGMHWVGFTTNQGGWIKNWRELFRFERIGEESVEGHPVVLIRYQQTAPRPGSFGIRLPGAFVSGSVLIRGTLWLDAVTAQLWKAEEEFTVRHKKLGTPFVWAHLEKSYTASEFGICVPRRIVLSMYTHYREPKGSQPTLTLRDRTALSYDRFRRFGVSSESEYQVPTGSR